jgi:hypothetical protein
VYFYASGTIHISIRLPLGIVLITSIPFPTVMYEWRMSNAHTLHVLLNLAHFIFYFGFTSWPNWVCELVFTLLVRHVTILVLRLLFLELPFTILGSYFCNCCECKWTINHKHKYSNLGHYVIRNFMIYAGHQVSTGQWNLGRYNQLDMWLRCGDKVCKKNFSGDSLSENVHLEDQEGNRRTLS